MVARGLTQRDAALWVDLTFRWKRIPVKGFDGTAKEMLLPVEFLGDGGSGGGSADNGIPAELMTALTETAAAASTHMEFITAAFEIDGVKDNRAATALVADEAFFNGVKAG
jgi:hypothetical protein